MSVLVGGRRRGVASALVVVLVAALLGWFAWRSSGATVHEADLSDGGAWISSDQDGKVGRVNKALGQLDAGVYLNTPSGARVDVLQDGGAVVAVDGTTGSLFPVDVRLARLGSASASVPGGIAATTGYEVYAPRNVALKGGTVAIVDPKSGKVWAQRVDSRAGIRDLAALAQSGKPLATVGAGAALTVDVAGNVHVGLDGQGPVVVTVPASGEAFAKPTEPVKVAVDPKGVDISAVGDRWVVYNPVTDTIQAAGASEPVKVGLSASEGQVVLAALQQPGAASDVVAVQGRDEVKLVGLDGSSDTVNGGVRLPEENGVSGNDRGQLVSRPLVAGGCVNAAWATQAVIFYNANCGQEKATVASSIPVELKGKRTAGVEFRQNRRVVLLNDLDAGAAYDLDNVKNKIDQWDSLTPPPSTSTKDQKNINSLDDALRNEPPKAEDDNVRARPGRTNRLFVLDNDNDPAGGILSIAADAVTDPRVDGVRAEVSGDGQAINLTVADQPAKSSFTFTYEVNNGRAKARATVTVELVNPADNGAPYLRTGAKQPKLVVPVLPGGQVPVQVVSDWRDPESDTLSLESSTASAIVDGVGRLNVTGPARKGPFPAKFKVVDEFGLASDAQVNVNVLDPVDGKPVAPAPQADATRGVVGKPIQLQPLENDLPGADPTDPTAQMRLVGPIQGSGALKADTNLDTGVVTLTSSAPGTFELSYGVQQGTTVGRGRIRVDVAPPANDGTPPVAVADTALLRDQAPAMVDVLANDSSPRSDVLVTLGADPQAPEDSWLRATVFQGRWVRVEAAEPAGLGEAAVRRGTLEYTISDGAKRARGTISVVQRGPLTNALPVVKDDEARVRVGDVVSVGVLDNDTMTGGIPLRIDPASVKVVAGGARQNAFLSGNVIRYVPEDDPRTLTKPRTVVVEYAAYPEGQPAFAQAGRARITVNPLPGKANPNQAPVARSFTASVVAGEALPITVPTSGVDPDGDSVTVTGVTGEDGNAMELDFGRIVSFGAASFRYESFPNAAGTEVIHYEVRDRFGETSTGFVRVGVVQPGDPQPPVAVDDQVMAAPGKPVYVPFTENDLISRSAGQVVVDHLDLNDADTLKLWKVEETDFIARTTAPEVGQRRQLTYGLDDGVFAPSRASVAVVGVPGFNNLPVALDDVAKPKLGEQTALVDVLANDRDIDSAPNALKVAALLGPNATIEGGKVRVKIIDHAYVLPYVVEDPDGGQAMAFVYVPTGDKGLPFVVDSALIEMGRDSTRNVAINDYVTSPRGRPVAVTAVRTVSSAPADSLTARVTGKDTLALTSSRGYVGPAAIMLEVTDRPSGVDPASPQGQDSGTAFVSVPVQIGPKVALLRCPTMSIPLVAGEDAKRVDIPTLCNAWTPIGLSLDKVTFTSDWTTEPKGVSVRASETGGRTLTLSADASAPSGAGVLEVGVDGSTQKAQIRVTVQGIQTSAEAAADLTKDSDGDGIPDAKEKDQQERRVAPPTMRPVSLTGLKEGESQTVDLRAYLNSALPKPDCQVLRAVVESGRGLTVTQSGCSVTVAVGARPSPTGSVGVDVTDKNGSDRVARGRITVTMLGRPGSPGAVSAIPDRDAGGQAQVSFTPPGYNGGSPITHYRVAWAGGSSGEKQCTASPCTVTGLTNGKDYTFRVWAANAVGESEAPGGPSLPVRPDTLPEAPGPPTRASFGDGYLVVAWAAPVNKGSAITKYRVNLVSSSGTSVTQEVTAPGLTRRVDGLRNNDLQSVKVQAVNGRGAGPWSGAAPMQSAGRPAAVNSLQVTSDPPADASTTASHLAWSPTDPNGPALNHYTVDRRVAGGAWEVVARVDAGTLGFNDTVPFDGRRWEWMVTATNGAGGAAEDAAFTSTPGNAAGFVATGVPQPISVQVTTPQPNYRATVTIQLGESRSSGYSRIDWSSGGQSGSWSYTGGAGTFTRNVGVDLPTSDQQMTVTAYNAGGQSVRGTSNSFKPFGPTRTPTSLGASRSGNQITWSWNTPQNGRPIVETQIQLRYGNGTMIADTSPGGDVTSRSYTGDDGRTYELRVRVRSEAGWSGWTGWDSVTIPDPPPNLIIDGKGASETGVCANCRRIAWHGVNVKPGSYSFHCFRQGGGSGSFYDGNVTMQADGGHSGDWCAIDPNLTSQVRVTINGGPSGFVDSAWHNW